MLSVCPACTADVNNILWLIRFSYKRKLNGCMKVVRAYEHNNNETRTAKNNNVLCIERTHSSSSLSGKTRHVLFLPYTRGRPDNKLTSNRTLKKKPHFFRVIQLFRQYACYGPLGKHIFFVRWICIDSYKCYRTCTHNYPLFFNKIYYN